MHDIKDLQDSQIQDQLQDILRAFEPRPSSDQGNDDLLYYQLETRPKLRDAYRLFREFAYNWEVIGALLNIPGGTIKEIKYDCEGESKVCLQEMLGVWLKRASPPPTWGQLKEAVENATYRTVDIPRKMARKEAFYLDLP